ncbi:hypothetical protein T4D_6294 [Trichinella pseudospiralis]|uniref:Uncharacterized protein n=1 Tax=Trichinella pseudospiralis TaxID=6337 RepID=A0A0V1DMA7_TRIPS|nr:hypothetical protein T4D_6294 [Trichinella pseudospiralis]
MTLNRFNLNNSYLWTNDIGISHFSRRKLCRFNM